MRQQPVNNLESDQIGALADILGEEVGAFQRKADRKMAAEFKRISISFAAVWDEITELRKEVARIHEGVHRSAPQCRIDSANVTVLKNARAS